MAVCILGHPPHFSATEAKAGTSLLCILTSQDGTKPCGFDEVCFMIQCIVHFCKCFMSVWGTILQLLGRMFYMCPLYQVCGLCWSNPCTCWVFFFPVGPISYWDVLKSPTIILWWWICQVLLIILSIFALYICIFEAISSDACKSRTVIASQ